MRDDDVSDEQKGASCSKFVDEPIVCSGRVTNDYDRKERFLKILKLSRKCNSVFGH